MGVLMRYLLRPGKILSTPSRLAEALGVEKMFRYPTTRRRTFPLFNTQRDFIMCWPKVGVFEDADVSTNSIVSFYTSDKRVQRSVLANFGVRTPDYYRRDGGLGLVGGSGGSSVSGDSGSRYVVRPTRHYGGRDFRITTEPTDYNPETHYICPLYEKTHEYRLVYCKGTHLITLLKQVPEGTPNDVPWNHSHGSRFVTVGDWSRCRLRHTTVLDDLGRIDFLSSIHLCGIDVMYNERDRSYAVCEINFCPALTIEDNIRKVVNFYASL